MLIALAYNHYQSQRVFVRLRIEKNLNIVPSLQFTNIYISD